MKNEQVAKIRKRLQTLREEILKVIEWRDTSSGSDGAMDEIDQANELIEKEMGFVMSSNMRANLKEVEDALDRIEKNHYGKCLHCPALCALLRALPGENGKQEPVTPHEGVVPDRAAGRKLEFQHDSQPQAARQLQFVGQARAAGKNVLRQLAA
jgi:RNA polymerase-binding transcription factor DksA